jgi:hypothetical protein
MSHLRCWTFKPLLGFPAHVGGVRCRMIRNKLTILLLCLIPTVFGCSNDSALSKEKFQSKFYEVKGTPGAQISDQGDYIVVMIPGEMKLFAFTKSDHAAYPGIIEYTFISDNGEMRLESYGWSGADHQAFEEFHAMLNSRVLEMAKGFVSHDT